MLWLSRLPVFVWRFLLAAKRGMSAYPGCGGSRQRKQSCRWCIAAACRASIAIQRPIGGSTAPIRRHPMAMPVACPIFIILYSRRPTGAGGGRTTLPSNRTQVVLQSPCKRLIAEHLLTLSSYANPFSQLKLTRRILASAKHRGVLLIASHSGQGDGIKP